MLTINLPHPIKIASGSIINIMQNLPVKIVLWPTKVSTLLSSQLPLTDRGFRHYFGFSKLFNQNLMKAYCYI